MGVATWATHGEVADRVEVDVMVGGVEAGARAVELARNRAARLEEEQVAERPRRVEACELHLGGHVGERAEKRREERARLGGAARGVAGGGEEEVEEHVVGYDGQ